MTLKTAGCAFVIGAYTVYKANETSFKDFGKRVTGQAAKRLNPYLLQMPPGHEKTVQQMRKGAAVSCTLSEAQERTTKPVFHYEERDPRFSFAGDLTALFNATAQTNIEAGNYRRCDHAIVAGTKDPTVCSYLKFFTLFDALERYSQGHSFQEAAIGKTPIYCRYKQFLGTLGEHSPSISAQLKAGAYFLSEENGEMGICLSVSFRDLDTSVSDI